jgi:hypothetical protein
MANPNIIALAVGFLAIFAVPPILFGQESMDSKDSKLSVPAIKEQPQDHALSIVRLDGPAQESIPKVPANPQAKIPKRLQWESASFGHRRLFFEEPYPERCSDSAHPGLQPASSAAKFVARTITLPIRVFLPR